MEELIQNTVLLLPIKKAAPRVRNGFYIIRILHYLFIDRQDFVQYRN